MTDLITRIEQADGPSRELFEEVWAASGQPHKNSSDEAFVRYYRYQRMLDAEAWTSAAEMLVPEGWTWLRMSPDSAAVYKAPASEKAWATHIAGVNYTHPSLALLAAILRAERNEP